MLTTLLMVDEFLNNAEGLRQEALRLPYPEQEGAFPGRNSRERINIEGLDEAVSRLVGEPLVAVSPLQSHAKCRLTLASDEGRPKAPIADTHGAGPGPRSISTTATGPAFCTLAGMKTAGVEPTSFVTSARTATAPRSITKSWPPAAIPPFRRCTRTSSKRTALTIPNGS